VIVTVSVAAGENETAAGGMAGGAAGGFFPQEGSSNSKVKGRKRTGRMGK
jgi:hypothetical protein